MSKIRKKSILYHVLTLAFFTDIYCFLIFVFCYEHDRATKDMKLETTPEIFISHPANKHRLVDIVADAINQSPQSNLSARKCDGDADTMIVMAGVERASLVECVIRADDSDILFLSLAQSSTEKLFVKRSGLIYDIDKTKKNMPLK